MNRKPLKKLNSKHKRFCEEYVIDLNATQAAIRAGYSKKTARSQGQRLLTNVDIQNFIQTLKAEVAERNNITIDWVVQKLKEVVDKDEKDRVPALDKLLRHLGGYERDNDQKKEIVVSFKD